MIVDCNAASRNRFDIASRIDLNFPHSSDPALYSTSVGHPNLLRSKDSLLRLCPAGKLDVSDFQTSGFEFSTYLNIFSLGVARNLNCASYVKRAAQAEIISYGKSASEVD